MPARLLVREEEAPAAEYRLLIRDLPTGERPRERLLHYGAAALSTAELLALLWRFGPSGESVLSMASRVLVSLGGLPGLARASIDELTAQHGIGEAKAIELKAALELGKRLLAAQPEERPIVRSPQDAANLLMADMMALEQEHLRVILLNTKNHVLGIQEVYRGSVNSAVVRVGEVLREAVRRTCPAVIVAHNHPSGDPTPSAEDVRVTRQLVEAGRLLDIAVLDHLIIGHQRFLSMKEKGLGF